MNEARNKPSSNRRYPEGGSRTIRNAAMNPVVETLTPVGYAVRGLIYIIMGLLAVEVSIGKSSILASPLGAITAIGKQPAGLILLWVVLIGIICYVAWGIARAVFDVLGKGHDMKGEFARLGFLVSAFGYAILILPTYGYASQTANGSSIQKFVFSVMAMPWGRYAIGLLGLATLAGGLYQVYLGFKPDFNHQFQTYTLTPQEFKLVTNAGRFGTAAR
jgi:hypothetical protein